MPERAQPDIATRRHEGAQLMPVLSAGAMTAAASSLLLRACLAFQHALLPFCSYFFANVCYLPTQVNSSQLTANSWAYTLKVKPYQLQAKGGLNM